MKYNNNHYDGTTDVETSSIIEQSKLEYFLENSDKITEDELKAIVESKTK